MPTEAFGSLWVLAVDGPIMNDGTEPAIHRIDPASNEVIASVPLPGRLCQGIGASPEALRVCGPDGLVRIDPASNEIMGTVELPAALVVSRIAYGAGSVRAFATSTVGPDTVVRIDPESGDATGIATGGSLEISGGIAVAPDGIWVRAPEPFLVRIDPVWVTTERGELIRLDQ